MTGERVRFHYRDHRVEIKNMGRYQPRHDGHMPSRGVKVTFSQLSDANAPEFKMSFFHSIDLEQKESGWKLKFGFIPWHYTKRVQSDEYMTVREHLMDAMNQAKRDIDEKISNEDYLRESL